MGDASSTEYRAFITDQPSSDSDPSVQQSLSGEPLSPNTSVQAILPWKEIVFFQLGFSFFIKLAGSLVEKINNEYTSEHGVDVYFLTSSSAILSGLSAYLTLGAAFINELLRQGVLLKYNTRKALIFISGMIAMLGSSLFVLPPQGNHFSYGAWFLFTSFIGVLGATPFGVLSTAWSFDLTRDEHSRSLLFTAAPFFSALGSSCALGFGYVPTQFAVIVVLLTGGFVVALIYVRNGVNELSGSSIPFIPSLRRCMSNPAFRVIFLVSLTTGAVSGMVGAITYFSVEVIFGVSTDVAYRYTTISSGLSTVSSLCALPITPLLIRRLGKIRLLHRAFQAMVLIGLLHLGLSFTTIQLYTCVTPIPNGIMGIFLTVIFPVMFSECVDYDEAITGIRRSAMYSAIGALPAILTSGLAADLTLLGLGALGFEAGSGSSTAILPPQPTAVAEYLRLMSTLAVSCGYLIVYLIFRQWPLTVPVMEKVREILVARTKGEQTIFMDPLNPSRMVTLGRTDAHNGVMNRSHSICSMLELLQQGGFATIQQPVEMRDCFFAYFSPFELQVLSRPSGRHKLLMLNLVDFGLMSTYFIVVIFKLLASFFARRQKRTEALIALAVILSLPVVYQILRLEAFRFLISVPQEKGDVVCSEARQIVKEAGEDRLELNERLPLWTMFRYRYGLHVVGVTALCLAFLLT